MAVATKIRRVANPSRRRPATRVSKRANPRKLSLAQKLHFGTARQRAAAKLALSRKRKTSRKPVARKRTTGVRNPALLIELGSAMNPQKRRSTKFMAKRRRTLKRRAANSAPRKRRAVRRHRRANPVSAAPVRRHRRRRVTLRHNPMHTVSRRRVVRRRRTARRNPHLFATSAFSTQGLKMVLGGLLGVTATKFVAGMIPANLTSAAGTFAPVVNNAIGALVAGMAAQKFIGGPVGDGFLFGGLMQAGSSLLNAVAPGLKVGQYPVALNGLGDLIGPANFAVPQNPLRPAPMVAAPAVPVQARMGVSGIDRAWGKAF